jgi:hypothetical protein
MNASRSVASPLLLLALQAKFSGRLAAYPSIHETVQLRMQLREGEEVRRWWIPLFGLVQLEA